MSLVIGFFRSIYRFFRGFIFMIGFMVLLTMVLILLKGTAPKFQSPSYAADEVLMLKWELEGELLSKSHHGEAPFRSVINLLEDRPHQHYVYDFKSSLEAAKQDPQVKGLFIHLKSLDGSFVEFAELRQLLMEFKRDSEKRIEIWASNLENRAFYLASVADRLHIAPEGSVEAPGPMLQMVYAGEAFEKLGIAFDVIRAGEFKSAGEPFIANAPSKEASESYRALEESLRKHMVEKIAEGRKTSFYKADRWLKRSFFTGKEALEARVVDGLSYQNDFELNFKETHTLVDFSDYQNNREGESSSKIFSNEGIAFIEIVGTMYMQSDLFDLDSSLEELQWAKDDDDVKSVVLRVDSPGGSALAADILWNAVKNLAELKPVIVTMGEAAASGGYYISVPATKIIAQATTVTGSIGVYAMFPNVEAFKKKYGVSFHTFSDSERSNLLSIGSKMTVQDRELLEKHVNATYQSFVNKVAMGRKMSFQEVDKIARGRVWTGEQAEHIGLVDEIGGLEQAFQSAKKLAEFDMEQKYPILRYEGPRKSWTDCFQRRNIVSCLFGKRASLEIPGLSVLENLPLLRSTKDLLQLKAEERVLLLHPENIEFF